MQVCSPFFYVKRTKKYANLSYIEMGVTKPQNREKNKILYYYYYIYIIIRQIDVVYTPFCRSRCTFWRSFFYKFSFVCARRKRSGILFSIAEQ